jgi:hypothetical protein
MKTNKAIKECARWLAYCMEIGWDKKDLDMLEKLWWKYHGDNSKIIQKSEEPSKGAEAEEILRDNLSDYCWDVITKQTSMNQEGNPTFKTWILEAMEQYRSEGLRDLYPKEFVEWTAFIYYDEIRWWVTGQEGMTIEELYEYYKSIK